MTAQITVNGQAYKVDLGRPLDISIPLRASKENVNAWYLDRPTIEPVKLGDWEGSVEQGASVNFNNIAFNPHAHVTHTECVGHITKEFHSVNKNLKTYFFLAEVITVPPEKQGNDFVISKRQLLFALGDRIREAIVIRTLPNMDDKLCKQYSNTNPPYLLEEAAIFLRERNVKHLLVDLPSVDKEKDQGKLLAHNAFWKTKINLRLDATITEFIYVPNTIADGTYLLNIQMAPFENDAAPSRPVLYKLETV